MTMSDNWTTWSVPKSLNLALDVRNRRGANIWLVKISKSDYLYVWEGVHSREMSMLQTLNIVYM